MAKFKDSLEYHSTGRKGKIEVISTKPCQTAEDLSLAYSPGVAEPCLAIQANPADAYKYTAKGNLVAVVSNGTAVLGLGNLGALAGKPVMEGKGILFKRFADIDVFDIELDTEDPDEIIKACQLLEPTFGGINLEDIKAPECFYIEEELKKTMNIPVFHDDQHGTAIISSAALINALHLVGKKMEDIRIVVNGAGASANSCAKLAIALGVKPNNMIMCDTKGVIYKGRVEGMNPYKELFAADTPFRTLEEAAAGADVLFGLSVKGAFTAEMVASMAPNPIIFAMANPDPEITPENAHAVRKDVIIATGRSDYPNQVNNVLGFPFIFRGALDVHASSINEEMKLAAVHALAALAREEVPDSVCKAYGNEKFVFGRDYIIPKPFDPRVLLHVAPAIAQAAMDSGVARQPIEDMAKYIEHLESTQGKSKEIMRSIINKAKSDPKKIVFPEGETEKILRAALVLVEEGIAHPILIGDKKKIDKKLAELNIELDVPIIDPADSELTDKYAEELYLLRQRKGLTLSEAQRIMRRKSRTHFGCMMVRMGDADTLLGGIDTHYPETIRPALEVIGKQQGLACSPRPLHDGLQEGGLFPGRHHRLHRPDLRRTGRDRHPGSRKGPHAGYRTAGRHAFLLQLRLGQPCPDQEGQAGCRDRQGAGTRTDGGGGDAGRHRRSPGDPRRLHLLQAQITGKRADLPGTELRQHLLQTAAPPGRRRRHRPDPDGHEQAGPRSAAR